MGFLNSGKLCFKDSSGNLSGGITKLGVGVEAVWVGVVVELVCTGVFVLAGTNCGGGAGPGGDGPMPILGGNGRGGAPGGKKGGGKGGATPGGGMKGGAPGGNCIPGGGGNPGGIRKPGGGGLNGVRLGRV